MPKIAETNFEAQGLKDIGKENTVQRLRELKNTIKTPKTQEKFEEKVEKGLGLLSRALENAKSHARDGLNNENIIQQLEELTDPWKAWSLDGRHAKPYMVATKGDKKENFQDKIYEAGMLGNSREARMFRQIWRQEMFEFILKEGWGDTVGIEKLLSTQKVPKQSFEGYIKPAETLGIKLDSATTTAMKKSTYEFTLSGIQKQFSVKSLRINIGGGMVDIPQNKAGELKFHHLALSSDGQTLYGLMKNGCEGNLVEIKTVPAQQNKDKVSVKTTVSPEPVIEIVDPYDLKGIKERMRDDTMTPVESPISSTLEATPVVKSSEEKGKSIPAKSDIPQEAPKLKTKPIINLDVKPDKLKYGVVTHIFSDSGFKEKINTGLFTFEGTEDPHTLILKYGDKKLSVSMDGDFQESLNKASRSLLGNENWRQIKIAHDLNKAGTVEEAQKIVEKVARDFDKGLYSSELDSINERLKKYQITDIGGGKFKIVSQETKRPAPTEKPTAPEKLEGPFDIKTDYSTKDEVVKALDTAGVNNYMLHHNSKDDYFIAGLGDQPINGADKIDPRLKSNYGVNFILIQGKKIHILDAAKGFAPIPLDGFDLKTQFNKTRLDQAGLTEKNKSQFEYSNGSIRKKPAVIEKEKKEINQIKNAKITLNQIPVKENSEDNNFALIIQDGFEIQGSVYWKINGVRQETLSKNMNNIRLNKSIDNTIIAEFDLKRVGSEVTDKRDISIIIPRVEKKEATDKETTAEDVEELLDEM